MKPKFYLTSISILINLFVCVPVITTSRNLTNVITISHKHNFSYINSNISHANQTRSPLLIILIDGMGWNLVRKNLKNKSQSNVGFNRICKQGVYVRKVSPVFPAECLPNIFSLFTGVHPIDHGVLFTTDNENQTIRSNVEILWETAYKQNKSVHLFNFPFCKHFNQENGFICEPYKQYTNSTGLQFILTSALEKLHNKSADLSVVYYDELDRLGHEYGPYHHQLVNSTWSKLDRVVEQVLSYADKFIPDLHIIITSDHGMTEVSGSHNLDIMMKSSDVNKVINRGSTVSLWLNPEHLEDVYSKLLYQGNHYKFDVYKANNLPFEWHTGGDNFPSILLVANPGYIFNSEYWPIVQSHYKGIDLKGMHGYGPSADDMYIPLFLYGPKLKQGAELDSTLQFNSVNVYTLMAYLGNIHIPEIKMNHLNLFKPILTQSLSSSSMRTQKSHENWSETTLVMFADQHKYAFLICLLLLFSSFLLLLLIVICCTHYGRKNSNRSPDMKEKLLVDNDSLFDNLA